MIRYKIIKNDIETNSWTSDFADGLYYEPSFGIPEHQVKVSDAIIDAKTGEVLLKATYKTIPAEYVLITEDLSAQEAAAKAIEEAKKAKKDSATTSLSAIDWAKLAKDSKSPELVPILKALYEKVEGF